MGRPPKKTAARRRSNSNSNTHPVMLAVPLDVYDDLQREAEENFRSVAAEVLFRIHKLKLLEKK